LALYFKKEHFFLFLDFLNDIFSHYPNSKAERALQLLRFQLIAKLILSSLSLSPSRLELEGEGKKEYHITMCNKRWRN